MDLVTLGLCVNNYRSGQFSGLCRQLCLGDSETLTIESPWIDRSLRCEIDRHTFRLGKAMQFPHFGHRTWVGNWCWDAVLVTPEVAAGVINFAVSKGYTPTVGATHLWNKINRGEPITAADLEASGP